jgi:hypothetical protein
MSGPGTSERQAVEAFLAGVSELELGYKLDLGPVFGEIFVMGGFGCGQTDCPQGNDDAGVKRQNAKFGCRCCLVPRTALSNVEPEKTVYPARTHESMASARAYCDSLELKGDREEALREFGLQEKESLYAGLKFDVWLGLPHDPFHLFTIGLTMLSLAHFAASLTEVALRELNWLLKKATPWFWTALSPIQLTAKKGKKKKRKLKGCGEAARCQIQLLPLFISEWFSLDKCNNTFRKALLSKHGTQQNAAHVVCESIKALAWACRCVWSVAFAPGSEATVQAAIQRAKSGMKLCWADVCGISFNFVSNFHAANHASALIRRFGSIRLCSCARGEGKNCELRRVSSHCNHVRPEYDMLLAQNIGWAIKFMIAGGLTHLRLPPGFYSPHLLRVLKEDNRVWEKLIAAATAGDSYVGHHEAETASMPNAQVGTLQQFEAAVDDQCQFLRATIPNRESSLAVVQVGCFFHCLDMGSGLERIGLVTKISIGITDLLSINRCDADINRAKQLKAKFDSVSVGITWLHQREGSEGQIILTLPAHEEKEMHCNSCIMCVCSPAHLVPLCCGGNGASSCAIAREVDPSRPAGCNGFCVGLNHTSASNQGQFFLNKYLAK